MQKSDESLPLKCGSGLFGHMQNYLFLIEFSTIDSSLNLIFVLQERERRRKKEREEDEERERVIIFNF